MITEKTLCSAFKKNPVSNGKGNRVHKKEKEV